MLAWSALALVATFGGDAPLTAVPFQDVAVDDSFWSPRIETNRARTIAANLRRCEETGRL